MLTVYGISNCDSCRNARKWFDANGVAYRFHDLRVDGLGDTLLEQWLDKMGWQGLLNMRSTTWRNLAQHERANVSRTRVAALLLEHPTLIKRPVVDNGDALVVGYCEDAYRALSQSAR